MTRKPVEERPVVADGPGDPSTSPLLMRLARQPAAVAGGLLISVFVLVALLAPWLAPYRTDDCSLAQISPGHLDGPSAQHWLGLDSSGCDELSLLIVGARQSLLVAVVSVALGATAGVALGLLAGAFGGLVDTIVMRVVDVMLAIPGLLLAIGVAATVGASLKAVMIAIAVVSVPVFARLLRGSMLGQRSRDYIMAVRSVGVSEWGVVFRHLLPNSLSPVLVQATLTLAVAIIEAAGLAFLGLGGADPRVPEWGHMLTEGQDTLAYAPQLAIIPGLAIVLSALGFTLLGECLREALDPKLRR